MSDSKGRHTRPKLTGAHSYAQATATIKSGGLSAGTLVILALSLLVASRKEWAALAVFLILVLVLWLAFIKPTQCDVEKSDGEGCGNTAHGRLRACHLVKHKRAKNDALWAMFRLRNPAIRYRIMWAQPRSSYGRVSPEPDEELQPRLSRPLYDGTMLVATVLAAVVAVITFALQFRLVLRRPDPSPVTASESLALAGASASRASEHGVAFSRHKGTS